MPAPSSLDPVQQRIEEARNPVARQILRDATDFIAAARTAQPNAGEVLLPPPERPQSSDAASMQRAAPKAAPLTGPLSSGPMSGPLHTRWTFEQTPAEAMLLLRGLPPETKPKDVRLNATSKVVSLSVGGEAVLTNAKLHLPCDPDESDFTLHDVGDTRTLAVSLVKLRLPGAPPSWPALLETAEML
mmetsp:Transcript_18821/g.60136  ORF Transcript_18821/g.60136 Transcript_18821/m.60136 type:complete len:187 (+) Transcript_18821:70-630(+)